MREQQSEVRGQLERERKLTPEIEEKLKAALAAFKEQYRSASPAAA
jgi:hypothetical protein